MRIITGMHRSGTSLVARLCREAEMDMGDPATFQEADRWNPDGYFEQKEIIGINMKLIHGPFWKFSYLFLPGEPTILKRAARLEDSIRGLAREYSERVVKDTRFCLTLPAWIACGARVDGVVACLREPAAVARSLAKRNRISLSRGYRLWIEHNVRLLGAAKTLPIRFVRYESFLDPARVKGEITSLFTFLGLDLPQERLAALEEACVKPDMNHAPVVRDILPERVRDLRDRLWSRHTEQAA